MELLSDPIEVVQEWADYELVDGDGYGLGKPLGELPAAVGEMRRVKRADSPPTRRAGGLVVYGVGEIGLGLSLAGNQLLV